MNLTYKIRLLILLSLGVLIMSCNSPSSTDIIKSFEDTTEAIYGPYRLYKLPIDKGVAVINPVQVSLGPGGRIFGANQSGEIYTLHDSNGDGIEDEAKLYADINEFGLHSPVGFAHKGDTVFIGTRTEVRAYLNLDQDAQADTSWTFFSGYPVSEHPYEWTSALNFGPDGWLYLVLTTDSFNSGASPDPKGLRGSMLRVSPSGKDYEVVATGLRSVHGMNFNTQGDLFFADNKGGGNAFEELNLLQAGKFYGHNAKKYAGTYDTITPPAFSLEQEVAPSGIEFNPGYDSFGGTAGELFVAYYGPGERWNRGSVSRVKMTKTGESYSYEEQPVADIPKLSDLAFGKDGGLYLAHHGISDYWYNSSKEKTGGFYKLVYDPSLEGKNPPKKKQLEDDFSEASLDNGKALFGIHACSACHAVDGDAELIGPNLKGIGKEFSKEELLEEIMKPSERIKPSMIATKMTLKNGKVHLGRIVFTDENSVSIMLVGNEVVVVPKSEVESAEEVRKSLMYENLLAGMSEQEIDNLLNYLVKL